VVTYKNLLFLKKNITLGSAIIVKGKIMGLSFGHLALLVLVILIVFGAGKLPQVMGDLARGLKAFKDGMKDGEAVQQPKIDDQTHT
jgi:sec-independent protein translocase protein TatA